MFDRIRLGFLAMFVALAFALPGTVRADEKKACVYCEAIKHVIAAMHCEKCKDAEQCGHCKEAAKKIHDAATCPDCDDKTGKVCKECAEFKLEAGCTFCAQKKAVADEVYCCKKCDEADKVCPKCEEMRKMVMSVGCKDCAAKKGHK